MDTSDSQEAQCDETISLSDVLVARDTCLPEDELWALCRECCLVLEVVNNSPDMFQTLCVTPDTVAFDQVGNVCFLDLDVDAEPIYLPPEYSTDGNLYKAHLFSLGMTLLYAAEYNVDHSKETVSPELREILGRMTADDPNTRPDLESTIILCEEQLCGQSSQEVCCGIAAVVGFGLPTEDNFDDATLATTSFPIDVSPEDYSHAESFIQSEQGDATYCDDIPDLTEDISQAESLPLSEQETVIVTEETTESHDESLPLSEETDMDKKRTKSLSSQNNNNYTTQNSNSRQNKPALPKKPELNGSTGPLSAIPQKGELIVSELFSESESSELSQNDRNNVLTNGSSNTDLNRNDSKSKERKSSSSSSKKELPRDNNQNITFMKYDETGSKGIERNQSQDSISSDKQGDITSGSKEKLDGEQTGGRNKRNRRKQGLTITDILDALDRQLTEAELWALCKEGTSALQRKKKHLPAYLSPDTLVIRESGNLSFKAIPEEKPLEVIFMAPELQEKGELTEKTCLFGLSVTLRCAAGKKYGTVANLNVSQDLKDLLQFLADANPVKRPELVDIAKACNEHGNGASSDSVCARLFQDTYTSMEEKSIQKQQKENIVKPDTPKISPPSAFKAASGASFQPVKPVPIGSNTSAFSSTGAFQPIPKKVEPKREIGEPRIPSAFSSPATHFKPIILQQTAATTNEKPSTIQEEKSQSSTSKDKDKTTTTKPSTSSSSTSSTQKKSGTSSPDQSNDKEKEVVKKLKELKKNLMKHKQPSMVKEIENEDKVSDVSKESESSTPNKKSLPPTPKKSGSSKSGERSKRRQSSGALDALLKEIQKQGNAPDTNSLASAIAHVLQSHLNQGEGTAATTKPPATTTANENPPPTTGELDMTVTSAQASLGQDQMLQNLDIPQQYHSQLVGQTMSLPMQYGGNMISGMPQFQFQQDPVTGYLQLIPVGVIPMRPQSVHSNSGSVHSTREFTSPAGSGTMMKDISSPDMSPKVYHNQSDVSNPSAISDNSGTRGKAPHGRTARDLVQKTANMRAKNLGRPSPSNVLNLPRDNTNGLYKWKSDQALDRAEVQFYSDSERAKHSSFSSLTFQNKLQAGYVYDDSMLNPSSFRNAQMTGLSRPFSHYGNGMPPHYRSPEDVHRHNINSTTSSPSPSTHDSGIGGMNHGVFRGLGPGADASLMDRLLSNVNVKQQRILGKIVHLLREEFAFDGYMENGVEDLAMAEYISSLGVLKWETFKSAIIEKYSDLYWHDDLLSNLFAAVNISRPSSGNRSSSAGQGRVPAGQRQPHVRPAGNRDDDSSGLSESNDGPRKTTHDHLQQPQQLSPLQNQMGKRSGNEIKRIDTSDSTDSENYSKRRRIKTKHELDKMKSNSNNSLLNENVNSVDMTVKSAQFSSVNGEIESKPPRVPGSVHSANLPNTNLSLSRQLSADSSLTKSNNVAAPKTLDLSASYDSRLKPFNQASPQSGNQLTPKFNNVNQAHLTVNGTANVGKSGLSREMSVSSHSSSQSDLEREVTEGVAVVKKGHVVYHWAMIQLCMSQEMERFMQDIDEQNSKMLFTKLSTLEQQIKMEKRVRRKTQKFYKSKVEANKSITEPSKNDKTTKGERNQILQVAKDITEMTRRIGFIDLCRTHIQMLLAELQGIDVSYLHSIAVCPLGEPLQLQPRPDNPLLQFQTLREPHSGCEIQALHAGTPDGLMAYLFASTALSDGYIHQFLFCYRYFTTAAEVLDFLISRYTSATKSGSTEANISRLQQRVIDLLHYWLEGYFSIDFKGRQSIVNQIREFVKEHIEEDSERGQSLLSLLSNCLSGNILELSSADPDEAEMHFWQRAEPKLKQANADKKKEWESFRSLIRGKAGGKEKSGKVKISAVVVERRRKSVEMPDALPLSPVSRRTDTFMLADYSALCLAEQLCLIEQGIFQQTHPVHYLDSKSRGVGVALTMKGMRTPAPVRRSGIEESFGLFIEPLHDSSAIQKMIDYGQEVSHWVAGEIVACSNPKIQIAVLSKFLFIAHGCMELRNFATCMSILDGLENLIVKQLPAWKHLPTKCTNVMEELTATRMFLKNDPLSLMQQGKDCHLYPTIPSPVFFLLHIQQAEIGGFKLANQMFKWGKMRSICQVIEQVRVYREHMYGFEADASLQETLRQRIHEMSTQDIQDLASNNDINYQKMSSATGISNAFKKMKGKFHAK